MDARILNKEDLGGIKFTLKENSSDQIKRKELMADLLRAQYLGNLEKTKVRIIFLLEDDSHGEVETTVWAVGEHHLMLKGGVHIPIRAIESISLL